MKPKPFWYLFSTFSIFHVSDDCNVDVHWFCEYVLYKTGATHVAFLHCVADEFIFYYILAHFTSLSEKCLLVTPVFFCGLI